MHIHTAYPNRQDSKKDIDFDTDLATEESITIISRRLRTSNHEKVVGKDITARARYIIDSKEQEEIAVYAGEVVDFKRNESIYCVIFPVKSTDLKKS